ncbi:MAG TPA: universal stress protein [Candidatus Acidoferrales bacterium]|nr:universal stress protein [Candidatus Acidoferrales bacterium]
MYKKILIPLDGSTVSQQVLPYARLMARQLNLTVELLEVVDVVGLCAAVAACNKGSVDSLIAETMRGSAAFLERISKTFSGGEVSCAVVQGRAGEVIIEKAAADSGTLIAMATHGRSGIDRWLLGSVVEKVVRGTTNPLLLVRAGEHEAQDGEAILKTMIVPLDGSPLAEKALPHAALWAKSMNVEMILFRAYRMSPVVIASDQYIPDWDQLEAAFKRDTTGYLAEKASELKKEGVAHISPMVAQGEAAEKIIDLAQQTAHHMVVICSHGRSGVKRWVLGSVAERVVRHSVGPVLVIRSG